MYCTDQADNKSNWITSNQKFVSGERQKLAYKESWSSFGFESKIYRSLFTTALALFTCTTCWKGMLTWRIRKYYSSKTVHYFRTLERISTFLTLAGAWSWSKFPAFASFIRDLASFDTKFSSAISISSVSQPSPNEASLTVAKRSVIGFSPYVAIFSRA